MLFQHVIKSVGLFSGPVTLVNIYFTLVVVVVVVVVVTNDDLEDLASCK